MLEIPSRPASFTNEDIMKHSQKLRDTGSPVRWELVGNHLAVRHQDGSLTIPSADEIYRVIMEQESMDGIPSPDDSSVITRLTFSKLPLRPEIIIEADIKVDSSLRIRIQAVGRDVAIPVSGCLDKIPDHLIENNIWYPFVPNSLDEIRETLRDASIAEAGPISLKNYLNLLKISGRSSIITDQSVGVVNARSTRASSDFAPEPSFTGTLLPYQMDGLRWLTVMAQEGVGGILADEMGLGKTVQIIALFSTKRSRDRIPSLVVAPGTILENWRREIERFSPSLNILVHRGSNRTGFPNVLQNNDIVIVSYDTLIRDTSLFKGIKWNIVVLDEAQAIKNPDTKRARAVKRISRLVGVAVTGTPIENRLRDLWSLTDFILPGLLGDQSSFESKYLDDNESAAAIEPVISPIILRRRIGEVANDLPDLIDIPQALELDPANAIRYESIRCQIIEKHATHATLAALMRLRMFCAHPWLTSRHGTDPTIESTKYLRLTEILGEVILACEKVIIFVSFRDMSDIMVADIENRFSIPTAHIDGRIHVTDRQLRIDQFSAILGSAVLILNPRAAGTGLNITAANHVIHYNLEWNPAVVDQATARCYRRGATRPVTVHRLFYVNTIEEIMAERLERKRELATQAVVGTDGAGDNTDDILAALRRSPMRASES